MTTTLRIRSFLAFSFASLMLVAIAVAAAAVAAEPAADLPGYDDTPMLPGQKWRVHDRMRPQPPVVAPADECGKPPADAIVLFDGKDLSQWVGGDEKGIEGGVLNILKAGTLRTKEKFADCQLHVEWMTPEKADGGPMQWGNSGVFLMDQFEVQIIESNAGHIYADGNAGAVYGQSPSLVNAARKPGQWQTFDIAFTAPKFEGGKLTVPARITVLHNGVLVQNNKEIVGETFHKAAPVYRPGEMEGPVQLQSHGSAVLYRNVWIRRVLPLP